MVNLILNGEFEGFTNWVLYTEDGAIITNPSAGINKYCLLTLPRQGINTQLYQYPFNLKSDTSYNLKFWLKSEIAATVSVDILKHDTPYTLVNHYNAPSVPSGTFFDLNFKTGYSIPTQLRFRFMFFTPTVYSIDRIVLEEIITCEQFSCILAIG